MNSTPFHQRLPPRLRTAIAVLSLILTLSAVGCAPIGTPPDRDFSILKDVAVRVGEPSPMDGIVVTPERYTHLLICENRCQE